MSTGRSRSGDLLQKTGPVAQKEFAAELDSAPYGMNLFRLQSLQFIHQDLIEAAWAGGKKSCHKVLAEGR